VTGFTRGNAGERRRPEGDAPCPSVPAPPGAYAYARISRDVVAGTPLRAAPRCEPERGPAERAAHRYMPGTSGRRPVDSTTASRDKAMNGWKNGHRPSLPLRAGALLMQALEEADREVPQDEHHTSPPMT